MMTIMSAQVVPAIPIVFSDIGIWLTLSLMLLASAAVLLSVSKG